VGFEILGGILDVEAIAVGRRIRGYRDSRGSTAAGAGETQGVRSSALTDGTIVVAETHWYEAAGIGRRDFKLKRLLGT
jgi:hypothetical protein